MNIMIIIIEDNHTKNHNIIISTSKIALKYVFKLNILNL